MKRLCGNGDESRLDDVDTQSLGDTMPLRLREEVPLWMRTPCADCGRSAMFYCPFCCWPLGVPEGVSVPKVVLPFRCDIIFDDAPKKSTGIHAKVLAPGQVRLVDLFTKDGSSSRTPSRCGEAVREVPDYDERNAVVLFPDEGALTLEELVTTDSFAAIKAVTVIAIDSPWRRAQVLRRLPQLQQLRSVRLQKPPPSRFWRYHAEGPGCVSTIEALAAFSREAQGSPDLGLEDPLLFLFARQFAQITLRSEGELPMEAAAKERRSARVRQKESGKRLRPMGAMESREAEA